jgi:hypothetical protein
MSQDAKMMKGERFEARLRPILFPIAASSCVVLFWIVYIQKGVLQLLFGIGLALAFTYCAYRFWRETKIVSQGKTVMATVTEYRQIPNSDGGSDRECKYRFTAADGREYVGHCESTIRDFPEEGYLIPIVYNRQNPYDNFPREMFWFYQV